MLKINLDISVIFFVCLVLQSEGFQLCLLSFLKQRTSLSTGNTFSCEPVHEGQAHTFLTHWKPSKTYRQKIALEMDGVLLATCDNEMTCVNYFDHVTQTSISASRDGSLWLNHTIVSASRRDAGHWSLRYTEGSELTSVIRQCHLKVYRKIDSIQCNEKWKQETFEISCKIEKVLTPAICMFSMHVKGDTVPNPSNITYEYEEDSSGQANHNILCGLQLPRHTMRPGNYTVDVTVHPDLTGDVKDVQKGAKISLHFAIEDNNRFKLINCTSMLGDGSSVICRHNTTKIGHPVTTPDPQSVTIKPTVKLSGHCDHGKIDMGVIIACKFVHSSSHSLQCDLSLTSKKGFDNKEITEKESYLTTEVFDFENNSNETMCSFIISAKDVRSGIYQVKVAAITQDAHYFIIKNISIVFEDDEEQESEQFDYYPTTGQEQHTSTFSYIYLILTIVTVLIIAVTIICVLHERLMCFKNDRRCCDKEEEQSKHHYEEIDDIKTTPVIVTFDDSKKEKHYSNVSLLE